MRILVIEDEPRILEFLRLGLEAEGFTVDAADDGAVGLRLALAEPYELVVLDLLLPQLDGFRLLGELRRARPDTPVLILSARSDLPTKLRSFGLGANDYLSKPFSFDELVARVRVHLRKGHESGESSSLRVGDLELDLARRRARSDELGDRSLRPGVPAALPPRLARRRDREQRAVALGRLGLQLRPRLERRRRLRSPAAQETWPDLADRNGPACRLSARGRLARSSSAGPPCRWAAWP